MAGYMPTDCPTREKHGWLGGPSILNISLFTLLTMCKCVCLGDMQVTAEEAMYNLWSPGIFSRFLSQMRDSQLVDGGNAGFMNGVVPGKTNAAQPTGDGKSNGLDISWTAAYPLSASWLIKYYNATDAVKEHWNSIKDYVDGQLRVAKNISQGGLPNFWTW